MLKLYPHDCCSLSIHTCVGDLTSKNLQMKAIGEANIGSLLHKIKPPLLENEGLEDCTLSPDSIQEAFLKTTTTPGNESRGDRLIVTTTEADPPVICDPKKGGELSEVKEMRLLPPIGRIFQIR
ncbi:unnamed protein product [Lactuca saligna]|uniref:Uncharacterized protein n=1 Tax=Lactuca saligna TaxID=75948 RepID=A0AA35YAH2_LACSI|nr:unnamed protein product [Lactuca saligna]